jgi:hypothetical protein
MGLIDVPEENRIEIKQLANAKENQGRNKQYDWVAGCLIAFACDLAAEKYKEDACVSLIPKTNLMEHYMRKYQMEYGGWQMFIEKGAMKNLIKKYLHV